MTFWQSAISSSLGAFIGFIGALIIFFLKEKRKTQIEDTATVQNLKMELNYNLTLYDKYEHNVQECIEGLSHEKKGPYLKLDYNFIGTFFAKQFYRRGLLLKYFHSEDMRRWNIMLNQISEGSEKYVTDCVDQWRKGEDIPQETVDSALKLEKDHLNYAKKMTKYILKSLQ